ncbi:hypothetical protein D3C72_932880 [compost metagenome]
MLQTLHFLKFCYEPSFFRLDGQGEQVPVIPWTAFVQSGLELFKPGSVKLDVWKKIRFGL